MSNVVLIAPKDTDSVSVGGENFEVKKGKVTVPQEFVEQLTGAHGFTVEGAEPLVVTDAPAKAAKASKAEPVVESAVVAPWADK